MLARMWPVKQILRKVIVEEDNVEVKQTCWYILEKSMLVAQGHYSNIRFNSFCGSKTCSKNIR